MIFAHTIDQILCGEKSQTRRLVKPEESLIVSDGNIQVRGRTGRVMYQTGKTYAVQPGRGKKAVARILLKQIRRETLASITDMDARAEGFSSVEYFFALWRRIHGSHADLRQEVWVLEFELVTAP
jgi:hypothetical protein